MSKSPGNVIESCNVYQSDINSDNSEPIKILLFPPKNKKFRVDQETNSIHIEPLKKISDDEKENCDLPIPSEGVSELSESPAPDKYAGDAQEDENKSRSEYELFNDLECSNIQVKEIIKITEPFIRKNCFLKGCKWSPDGLCLLSNSEDNVLRLFEIPESTADNFAINISPVLLAKEGGTIYDYEWYPKMCSSDPLTCVFASTSLDSPIHLWDAYTGCLRATYQPINQYDEVTAAYSIAFSPDGTKIYSGFKKFLRLFDISIPGRTSEERCLKPKGSSVFQTNIISCISVNHVLPSIYALGSYDKTIGIYTEPEGILQCLLKGHRGGVTQIKFSENGIQLYSGARKDSEILCWDLRNLGKILCVYNRCVNTNQRIYFDLWNRGSLIATGSTDGKIMLYDTKTFKPTDTTYKPLLQWEAHNDCVNGVNFHPFRPVLVSSSGQYHFPTLSINSEEEIDSSKDKGDTYENSIKLWSFSFNP